MRTIAIVVTIALLLGVATAGGEATATSTESADLDRNMTDSRSDDMKDQVVAPVLQGLMTAETPEAYAHTHQLELTEEGVLVVIDQRTNASLPASVHSKAWIGHPEKSGRLVQATVAVDALPKVAANPSVRAIRPPERSVPLASPSEGSQEQLKLILGILGAVAVVTVVSIKYGG